MQVNSVRRDLRRTDQVIQLNVDPYKAGSIVGCRIVYLSHNYNITINQLKKNIYIYTYFPCLFLGLVGSTTNSYMTIEETSAGCTVGTCSDFSSLHILMDPTPFAH